MCWPRVVLRTAILVRDGLKLLQFTSLWRSRLPNTGGGIFSTLVFYFAIKNFTSKLSRKVKVFSLAENKPADIFLQLRLMSSEN